MKNKNWLKSPWSVSLGTVIFSFFLTLLNDHLKNKPILSTLLQILKAIFNFIILILNFKLKVWWLIIGIIIISIISYLITYFKENEEEFKQFKPDFCSYKNEIFKHWRWSWDWKLNPRENKWQISDLNAHCPRCNTPLIDRSNYYELIFECPRCDFKARGSQCEEPQKIELLISDNLNRKEENDKNVD